MDVSAYDLLATAILLLREDGCVGDANTAAEELFGVSRRLLVGRPAIDVLGGDDALRLRLSEALDERLSMLTQPWSVGHDDNAVPVTLVIVPVHDSGPYAVLVEVRVRESQTEWERHQQLGTELAVQRDVLRNLGHEVKNPLGGIRGAAQLLDSELDQQELREYTGVIIAEADRLASLVDRLIAPQNIPLHVASFNVHLLCERVRVLVGAEFADIKILRDYDASLPEIVGDFSSLLQALLNIARNAAQVLTECPGQQHPELIFKTRIARQVLLPKHYARLAVVVSVIDNGPGVPQELADRLFHPLVTGRAGGRGLGLHLARELVSQHGGILEWSSRRGHTDFRMILPVQIETLPLESK